VEHGVDLILALKSWGMEADSEKEVSLLKKKITIVLLYITMTTFSLVYLNIWVWLAVILVTLLCFRFLK